MDEIHRFGCYFHVALANSTKIKKERYGSRYDLVLYFKIIIIVVLKIGVGYEPFILESGCFNYVLLVYISYIFINQLERIG